MHIVVAHIRHEAFDPIRTELLDLGFATLTVSEVQVSRLQDAITVQYRGAKLTNHLRPMVRLECAVAASDVSTIVATVLKHARKGSDGDGQVFVMPVQQAYQIHTGKSDEQRLQAHPYGAVAMG